MNGKKAKALRREARAIMGSERSGHQTISMGLKLVNFGKPDGDVTKPDMIVPVACEQIVCVGFRAAYLALKTGYKRGEIEVAPDGDVTVTGKGKIGAHLQNA